MAKSRVGLWLIGAKGGVASTAVLGLLALKKGLVGSAGLVSELPQLARLDLAAWDQFVVAGHEIRRVPLADEAMRMARESRHPVLPGVVDQCQSELEEIDRRIRPGTTLGVGNTITALADWFPRGADCQSAQSNKSKACPSETPRQAIARLKDDMAEFARRENLTDVIVVNVSSTEPTFDASKLPLAWADLEPQLDTASLPASSLYAIAAFELGYSYINFTPSLGESPSAIDELARLRGACHYGCDGKTGETLMKSVLAPMFARRNLEVLSWVGHNIFGNMDGRVLDDPANKRAKVASKDHLIGDILGYRPNTLVSIEYLPDLGDWKTAWDHIHFAGFLGVPMTLQFIWQGCDSLLAAPLVLDLVRLTEFAHRGGHAGQMPFLASFFKSPYGVAEQCFDRQFTTLEAWANAHSRP
ncbi:MAG: inositol-3-phosphate synthase [Planctomycetaceae bacterium]|nr:inositol-3-phosphate synthase [Planctomycetaceae bacterium]